MTDGRYRLILSGPYRRQRLVTPEWPKTSLPGCASREEMQRIVHERTMEQIREWIRRGKAPRLDLS